MKCPKCGLLNPAGAALCDCGYELDPLYMQAQRGTVTETQSVRENSDNKDESWPTGIKILSNIEAIVTGLLAVGSAIAVMSLGQSLFVGIIAGAACYFLVSFCRETPQNGRH
jgi:hypothetical protein